MNKKVWEDLSDLPVFEVCLNWIGTNLEFMQNGYFYPSVKRRLVSSFQFLSPMKATTSFYLKAIFKNWKMRDLTTAKDFFSPFVGLELFWSMALVVSYSESNIWEVIEKTLDKLWCLFKQAWKILSWNANDVFRILLNLFSVALAAVTS